MQHSTTMQRASMELSDVIGSVLTRLGVASYEDAFQRVAMVAMGL